MDDWEYVLAHCLQEHGLVLISRVCRAPYCERYLAVTRLTRVPVDDENKIKDFVLPQIQVDCTLGVPISWFSPKDETIGITEHDDARTDRTLSPKTATIIPPAEASSGPDALGSSFDTLRR